MKTWQVLKDQSGDFTGKEFSSTEVRYMIRFHSFDPDTILQDDAGKQYRYHIGKMERIAA
jgi:hypothetical protein